jgi:hypothetical protein
VGGKNLEALKEYYFEPAAGKLWQLIEEETEVYSESAQRTELFFRNVLDPDEIDHTYADLMDKHFIRVTEMEAIAWLSQTAP